MIIGIDIDDTITNTFEVGMKYAEEFTKKYCGREYIDIYKKIGEIKSHRHWQIIFDWNIEEEHAFFDKYYEKIISEVELKEEVLENINKLWKDDKLIFITARSKNEGEHTEEITKNWLQKNNIPYDKIYYGQKKSEVCKENNVDIFIDDSYENCKSVRNVCEKVFLIDHITNRNINDQDIERVYGWNDIYDKIIEYKEVKNGHYETYSS